MWALVPAGKPAKQEMWPPMAAHWARDGDEAGVAHRDDDDVRAASLCPFEDLGHEVLAL